MIRALQKKFVITSMTAISVLLLVLLGGINITNIVLSEKETSRTLGWITAQELGEFPDKPFSGNQIDSSRMPISRRSRPLRLDRNAMQRMRSSPPIILSCAQILPGRSSPPMSPASRP